MPAQYEAIRDKLVKQGMPVAEAKSHAARIYNAVHPHAPVTGSSDESAAAKAESAKKLAAALHGR